MAAITNILHMYINIYNIVNVALGYLIGEIMCFIIPTKKEIRKLILIVCMFSNSTSIQLIYVDSLGSILSKMTGTSEKEAKTKGYVIVLIYTIFVNFLRWSIGYNIMKPNNDDVDEEDDPNRSNNQNIIEYSPNMKDDNKKNDSVFEFNGHKDDKTDTSIRVITKLTGTNREGGGLMKLIKEGINMPFIAGVVAISLSSLPYIGPYLKDPDSIAYKLIVESCDAVGKCASTFVILILGLNMSISLRENTSSDRLDK